MTGVRFVSQAAAVFAPGAAHAGPIAYAINLIGQFETVDLPQLAELGARYSGAAAMAASAQEGS